MKLMRALSQIFILGALGLLLFDIAHQWVTLTRFKIRNLGEFWGDMHKASFERAQLTAKTFVSSNAWEKFIHLPAPAVIAICALFFYLLYRFLFYLSGDKKSARL